MNTSVLTDWMRANPYALLLLAGLALALFLALRWSHRAFSKTPGAVVMAAVGAVLCTTYSGDTSWGFARDHLGMSSTAERSVMFAAAEVALFSMALMARQNLRLQGTPGAPGVLVWVITGVQTIPAYSESGIVAGTVRAFVGPVLAALLWHLAMGIELRHSKPGADSQSLPALLARELRERLLSRLGLSRRGRDAVQISRDRWTGIATRRAARLADLGLAGARPWRLARARRSLAVAVDRTDAGLSPDQQAALLGRLSAFRNAAELASMALPSPWQTPVSEKTEMFVSMTSEQANNAAHELVTETPAEQDSETPHDRRAAPVSPIPVGDAPAVVPEPVIMTTADLRRQARKLHRAAVSETGKPVTIDQLRNTLGVPRREAATLRQAVVGGPRRRRSGALTGGVLGSDTAQE